MLTVCCTPTRPWCLRRWLQLKWLGHRTRDLLVAIVAGYEVCCRLGNALDPTSHYARGFHPAATTGTFGAAASAGKLLGLDATGIASAFGVAASQVAGSLQFLVHDAWNKLSGGRIRDERSDRCNSCQ